MHDIYLSDISDEFVIHYGGQLHSVEANTFANSLVYLSQVIEEISFLQNPDFSVEIRIEALAEGSFRPKIKLFGKTIKSKLTPFFPEKNQTIPILIATLALFNFGKDDSDNITINDSEVIIAQGETKIIIERKIYDKAENIKSNKIVAKSLSDHFQTIENDSSIESFGLAKSITDKEYLFYTDRKHFNNFINIEQKTSDDKRIEIKPNQTLRLLKVILERGSRKWEFVWNGIKISAPVFDDDFWEQMRKREISISQGDAIVADLKIYQVLDPYSGIYFNEKYEIINVKSHEKVMRQQEMI